MDGIKSQCFLKDTGNTHYFVPHTPYESGNRFSAVNHIIGNVTVNLVMVS